MQATMMRVAGSFDGAERRLLAGLLVPMLGTTPLAAATIRAGRLQTACVNAMMARELARIIGEDRQSLTVTYVTTRDPTACSRLEAALAGAGLGDQAGVVSTHYACSCSGAGDCTGCRAAFAG